MEEKRAQTEAHRLLDNCVLFRSLSPNEHAAISTKSRIRTYKAGETVFAIGSPGDQIEVDPVSWTPEHLCSRSPRWRRRDHPIHRNSVARWSSWYVLAARRRSWRRSLNRRRSQSEIGSGRPSAMPVVAAMA